MFKQLKIRFNIIYIISIALILGASLFVIYSSTYRSTVEEIDKRLEINKIETMGHGINNQQVIEGTQAPTEFEPIEDDTRFTDEIIVENNEANIDQIIIDTFGTDFTKLENNNIITNGEEYYAYNQLQHETKFIDVSKDINYLDTFKTNLVRTFILILIFAAIFGYFFINQLIRPVAENYERQKEFVADASHELKTPLAVLKSCLNLIAKGDSESEELIKYSQMEVDRLTSLTTNLLKLSETDAPSAEVIDISYQTNLILSGIEVQLFEKNIIFTSDVHDELNVNISSEEYSQLIHILIDNAVKYNDKRRKVKLSLHQNKMNAELIVSNTADPISRENLNKLFDRFYREDKSRNDRTKGFGLGLSIANHIVNKYDGSIEADYQNSRFKMVIKLPIK